MCLRFEVISDTLTVVVVEDGNDDIGFFDTRYWLEETDSGFEVLHEGGEEPLGIFTSEDSAINFINKGSI